MLQPQGIARRKMTLFFIIDVSGSMEGSKLQAVNQAIEEVIPELKSISLSNADAEIQVAIMKFSDDAQWLTLSPVNVENYTYKYIQDTEGGTNYSNPFHLLNDVLSKNGFLSSISGSYAPAIFFMSDGWPEEGYQSELYNLKNNPWFKKAIKVSCAIGDDADCDILAEFTGTSETVATVHTPENLKKFIRFVSVTSSQIGSASVGVGSSNSVDEVVTKQQQVANAIQANITNFTDDEEDEQW